MGNENQNEDIKVDPFLDRFAWWVKKNIQLIIKLFLSILLIFIILYSYTSYRNDKDRELSFEINESIQEYLKDVAKQGTNVELIDSQKKNIDELKSFYSSNKGYKNGVRALYMSALFEYKNNLLKEAKRSFEIIFNEHQSHYLAPIALFYLANISEIEGSIEGSINFLEQYKENYFDNFLIGEVILSLARNYLIVGNFLKANNILKDIMNNEKFNRYQDRAQVILDYIYITDYSHASKNENSPLSNQPSLKLGQTNP